MLLLVLLLQSAQPAPTRPPLPPLHGGPQEMTCPVGGERFSAWRPSMYSTYGERPDGKPYSYLLFPFPVPQCPDNKLVVFDAFSPDEVDRLEKLIVTPDYLRLVTSDTPYYRGFWLAEALHRPQPQSLRLLLSAIWEVAPDDGADKSAAGGERLVRYQKRFIAEAQELAADTAVVDRVWIHSRAANAARQLGEFKEAEELRLQAEAFLAHLPDKRGWEGYVAKLKGVIARRDQSIEPLDMIRRSACPMRASRSATRPTLSAKPDVAEKIEVLRKTGYRGNAENVRTAAARAALDDFLKKQGPVLVGQRTTR